MVQLLVDAGADTTREGRRKKSVSVSNFGPPLALTNKLLRQVHVAGEDSTEEQLNRLEAVRRLLMQVEAVHAVSWLWHIDIYPE